MKNVAWFVLGTAAGFVLAHIVDRDPRGHEVLADIDARVTEFTDRIGDAYREQQTRFAELAADVKDVTAKVADDASDAAARIAKSD